MNRLPPEAYQFYVQLGHRRTYKAVAHHFGVSERTVQTHASRDRWVERVRDIEAKAQAGIDKALGETLEQTLVRQVKILRAIVNQGLETLRVSPINSPTVALRAVDIAFRHEREIRTMSGFAEEITIE